MTRFCYVAAGAVISFLSMFTTLITENQVFAMPLVVWVFHSIYRVFRPTQNLNSNKVRGFISLGATIGMLAGILVTKKVGGYY